MSNSTAQTSTLWGIKKISLGGQGMDFSSLTPITGSPWYEQSAACPLDSKSCLSPFLSVFPYSSHHSLVLFVLSGLDIWSGFFTYFPSKLPSTPNELVQHLPQKVSWDNLIHPTSKCTTSLASSYHLSSLSVVLTQLPSTQYLLAVVSIFRRYSLCPQI